MQKLYVDQMIWCLRDKLASQRKARKNFLRSRRIASGNIAFCPLFPGIGAGRIARGLKERKAR